MPDVERRLAAVMFTDMVDYTSLSERDELLAMALLDEQRNILRPIFTKHAGHEVKTLGDGFLVEFPSALEAVRCAIEIQEAMGSRNRRTQSDQTIHLRVAIHLGDVEHRGGDIYGDAVNIASRVQELADPGGICITQQVYDNIRNSREFRTTALGSSKLKNVKTPVDIYRVELATTSVGITEDATEPRRVAVLPLTSLSSDQQDEFFADGLTEEIINSLSSVSGLRVIARTSVMKYKNAKKTVDEIGRELKVGTILEGSVRKAALNVRITLQLIDVKSEAPIWAQKYDRQMKNVFDIQTDIAEEVADSLKLKLLKENKRQIEKKAPDDVAAYILYLRGRYYWNKRSKADLDRAISLFEEAVKTDPSYALAFTGLADCYTLIGRHRYLDPDEVFPKARAYAEKALQLNESLAEAHTSLAAVLFNYNWDWSGAEDQFRRAIELNQNYANAHYWLSLLLLTTARLDEAVSEVEKAQALDPLSPVVGGGIVQAYFFQEKYEKAIGECNKYLELEPNFIVARDFLVHLHVMNREFDIAEKEAKKLIDTSERKAEALAHLAYINAVAGRTEQAKKQFDQIMSEPELDYANSTIFITVYSALGDQDNAYRFAREAIDNAKISFPSIRFSPDLKAFRNDSRYESLLQEARLESGN